MIVYYQILEEEQDDLQNFEAVYFLLSFGDYFLVHFYSVFCPHLDSFFLHFELTTSVLCQEDF